MTIEEAKRVRSQAMGMEDKERGNSVSTLRVLEIRNKTLDV
jgi:hypothetical protein